MLLSIKNTKSLFNMVSWLLLFFSISGWTHINKYELHTNVSHKKNYLASSGSASADKGYSTAKNFLSSAQVSQQTGALSVGMPVAWVHDGINGPDFTLSLSYSYGGTGDRFGLGNNWGLSLPFMVYHGNANPSDRVDYFTDGAGQSYPLKSNSDNPLALHKLNDIHKTFDQKTGNLVFWLKDGSYYVVAPTQHISSGARVGGYIEQWCNANQQCVDFEYKNDMGSKSSSHTKLSEIVDDATQKVLVKFTWGNIGVDITSMDASGSLDKTVELNWNASRNIISVQMPDDMAAGNNTKIHIYYCGSSKAPSCNLNTEQGQGRIAEIDYPTGLQETFRYDTLLSYAMDGKTVLHTPVVTRERLYPRGLANAEEYPPLETNYNFAYGPKHNNYMGWGAILHWAPNMDALYESAGYTYTTSKDNGLTITLYTYNRFHLLVRQATYVDEDGHLGQLLTYTNKCYPGYDGTDMGLCLSSDTETTAPHDSKDITFSDLPANYSFAKKVFTDLVPLANRETSDNKKVPARMTSESATYDNAGNRISSVGPMGIKKTTVFCQPTKQGDNSTQTGCPVTLSVGEDFIKYPWTETETGSHDKLSSIQQFSYTQDNLSDARAKATLFGYLEDNQPVFWKASNFSYCTKENKACNESTLAGLLSSESTTTMDDSSPVMTLDTSYTMNSDGSYETSVSFPDKSQQVKTVSALYADKSLSTQAGDSDTMKIDYTPGGNVKDKKLCSLDGTCKTFISYQYIEAANSPDGLNHIITTYPAGWQTNEAYDGLNHLIYDASRDGGTGNQWGLPAQGIWVIHDSNVYDRYGRAIQTNTFNHSGDTAEKVSSKFYFDNSGRNQEKVWPANKKGEQLAETSLVDVAYNRTITFKHLINAQKDDAPLQALAVEDSDDDSNVIGKYQISVDPASYTGSLKTQLLSLISQFKSMNDSLMNHENTIGELEDFVENVIQAKAYYQSHTYQYDGLERLVGENINGHEIKKYIYSPEGFLEANISEYPQEEADATREVNYNYDCLNGKARSLTVVGSIHTVPTALCKAVSLSADGGKA